MKNNIKTITRLTLLIIFIGASAVNCSNTSGSDGSFFSDENTYTEQEDIFSAT
jgi:hypothetical protein